VPRLIRIALTFFISATILLFLVRQRALRLKTEIAAGLDGEAIRLEKQMVDLGSVIVGALILGGIALVVISIVRSRRQRDHG